MVSVYKKDFNKACMEEKMLKTDHYSQNDREVKKFFDKKFYFRGQWVLPKEIYKSPVEVKQELQDMKDKLNNVKSQLNDLPLDKWSRFTKFRDPSGSVIRSLRQFEPEILTQAWCKFFEILSQFRLLPQRAFSNESLTSLHLCEAPGGFISALNHFLAKYHPGIKWQWIGSSLNPSHEGITLSHMIPDDRLIRYSLSNWNFGLDNTGDLTQYYNYLFLANDLKDKEIGLVTADGSIDCMFKPEEQESIVHFIHYCETITALSVLAEGGNFVIKMFTMFEQPTISLMYFLNCVFQHVVVYKPCTSKHGNSEVYVLCTLYKGKQYLKELWAPLLEAYKNPNDFKDLAMFSWKDMGPEFLSQIKKLSEFFMEMQIKTINDNVNCFKTKYGTSRINRIKSLVVDYFLKKCSVSEVDESRKIIPSSVFKEIPQHQRFCFHNRFWKFQPDWIFEENCKSISNLNEQTENCVLDLKLGKLVTKILYSPYYSCQSFSEFQYESFSRQSRGDLYHRCLYAIHSNAVIITMSDLPCSGNSKFQRLLFRTVMNKLELVKDSLIFIQIPFVSNVVVSLLYILSLGFEETIFFKGGIVQLLNPVQRNLGETKKYLRVVELVYCCLDRYHNFKFDVDILQIVSPLTLEKNEFYKCVWNYNNSLCNSYLKKIQ